MNERVQKLRALLSLVQRSKKLLFVGVPAVVTVLWMMSLSQQFAIGSMAIKSGFFVFVAIRADGQLAAEEGEPCFEASL